MSACGVSLATLVAYGRGEELDPAEARAVADGDLEAHLFACAACARRAAWLAAVAAAYPAAVHRRGGLDLALTASMVDRLAAAGVVMRQYRPGPNQDIACTVAPEDDLSVSWIPVAPAAGERVDVFLTGPGGVPLMAVEDAPLDPASGCIIYARSADSLRPLPDVDLHLRVVAVGAAGTRPLGEHVFRHRVLRR